MKSQTKMKCSVTAALIVCSAIYAQDKAAE